MASESYTGFRSLQPIADVLDIPIDQVNFLICLCVGLIIGVPYRKLLAPGKTTPAIRHGTSITLGLCLAIFCFGVQIQHIFYHTTLCLILLRVGRGKLMPISVFLAAMLYLSVLQIYRAYVIDVTDLIDVSGPMMVMTQKMSSLAFNLYDGNRESQAHLSDTQKRKSIRKMPSVLEYYSYLLNFHGILVGPMSFYSDYIAFVEGTDVVKHRPTAKQNGVAYPLQLPSPVGIVSEKLGITAFWILVHLIFSPHFPALNNADPEFIRRYGWLYRTWFMIASMLFARTKYYVSWSLADAVNNASGFGFNGYDENGKARWDLISNIKILKLEFATSTKTFIENWNIQTTVWLRLVCYDRIPVQKTLATFMLSGLWHGFHPGYYFSFLFGTFGTVAGRKIRNNIRPFFLTSEKKKLFYDVVTWLFTQLAIAYLAVPFTVLYTRPTFNFYNGFYWWVHIAVITAGLVLPKQTRKKGDSIKTNDRHMESENSTSKLH